MLPLRYEKTTTKKKATTTTTKTTTIVLPGIVTIRKASRDAHSCAACALLLFCLCWPPVAQVSRGALETSCRLMPQGWACSKNDHIRCDMSGLKPAKKRPQPPHRSLMHSWTMPVLLTVDAVDAVVAAGAADLVAADNSISAGTRLCVVSLLTLLILLPLFCRSSYGDCYVTPKPYP